MLSSADLPGKALMANMKQYKENKAVRCVKIKERQSVLVDYTEFGLIPPIWSSEPTRLWLNQSAKLFRLENRFVS